MKVLMKCAGQTSGCRGRVIMKAVKALLSCIDIYGPNVAAALNKLRILYESRGDVRPIWCKRALGILDWMLESGYA